MSATIIAIIVALGSVLGGGGVVALVRIAVASSDRRADDWRTIAQKREAANDLLADHVGRLVGAVEQSTAATRECLALLQNMAIERRGAA